MNIRHIETMDIPEIIHMGGRMHEEGEYKTLEYDPEKVLILCQQAIKTAGTLGLVATENNHIFGMLGAVISEAYFSKERIAYDLAVYVKPEHRGSSAFVRMAQAYVKWARAEGARLIFLRPTAGINVDKITDIYTRLGFHQVGGIFSMEGVK